MGTTYLPFLVVIISSLEIFSFTNDEIVFSSFRATPSFRVLSFFLIDLSSDEAVSRISPFSLKLDSMCGISSLSGVKSGIRLERRVEFSFFVIVEK